MGELAASHPDNGLTADKLQRAKKVMMTAKTTNNAEATQAPSDAEEVVFAENVLEKISGPTT